MKKHIVICCFLFFQWALSSYAEEFIAVKPSEALVEPGAKVPFMVGLYVNGQVQPNVLPWDFKFSAAQGTFSGSVYSAPTAPGIYVVFVEYKKIRAMAMVIVKGSEEVRRIDILPKEVALSPGKQVKFEAKVFGTSGNPIEFRPAWGAKGGKIDPDGTFTAGNQTGKFEIVCFGPHGIKSAAMAVIQEEAPAAPVLTKLEVLPENVRLEVGKTMVFKARGRDQYGNEMESAVSWSASGGTIDAAGKFTAENAGQFTIVAKQEEVLARANVEVVPVPPVLVRIEIEPKKTRVEVGETVHFKAQGIDQFGEKIDTSVTWIAFGGKIDANGKFTSESTGEFTIVAKQREISGKSSVEVVPPPRILARIEIEPKTPSIRTGESIVFTAQGIDRSGERMDVPITWSASGGKIDASGKFTAEEPGKFIVVALALESNVNARAEINVMPVQSHYRIVVSPQSITVIPGEKVRFEATLYRNDKEEWTFPWDFNFHCDEGTFDDAVYTAPRQPGHYEVKVVHHKASARATVIVKAPAVPKEPAPPQKEPTPPQKEPTPPQKEPTPPQKEPTPPQKEPTPPQKEPTPPQKEPTPPQKEPTPPQKEPTPPQKVEKPEPKPEKRNPVAKISLYTNRLELDCGEHRILKAVAMDATGSPMDVKLDWKAQGGEITKDGEFRAGDRPGIYKIKVGDPTSGVTEEIVVEIKQRPVQYRLETTPARVVLPPGGKQLFKMKLLRDNKEVLTWEWEYTGIASGGIYKNGEYTAPTKPGKYHLSIRHPQAQTSIPVEVVQVKVIPYKITAKPGEKVQFKAIKLGEREEMMTTGVFWSCSGGGTLEPQGMFTVGEKSGVYEIRAIVKDLGISADALVTVEEVSPYLLKLEPESVVLEPGTSFSFQASVYRGTNKIWVFPWEFSWTSSAGFFQGVVYTSPQQEGNYTVTVKYQNLTASSKVTVKAPDFSETIKKIDRFSISPSGVSLTSGQKQAFTLLAYDSKGEAVAIPIPLKWKAMGGTIDSNGVFSAGDQIGEHEVCAVLLDKVVARTSVKIIAHLVRISVVPSMVGLRPHQEYRFKARGYLQRGEETDVSVTWYATGGKIREDGVYTAGEAEGESFIVQAYHPPSGRKDTAFVSIKKFEDVSARLEIEPRQAELSPGKQQIFLLEGFDRENRSASLEPRWFCTGGTIVPTEKGAIYTAGEQEGHFDVTAIDGKSSLFIRAMVRIIRVQTPIEPQTAEYTLQVEPELRMVMPGQNLNLRTVLYQKGKPVITNPWEFKYSTSGGILIGEYGNIWIAPVIPGKYSITVSHRFASTTLYCTVSSGISREKLSIVPEEVSLSPNQRYSFQARTYDENGEPFECKIVWSATGGTIDNVGNYISGSVPGMYKVIAQAQGESHLRAVAKVFIQATSALARDGEYWGMAIKSGQESKERLVSFVQNDLFFKSSSEIENFKESFGREYGNPYFLMEIWRMVLENFGESYGRKLRNRNVSEAEVLKFMKSYLVRLPLSDQISFRSGFFRGYAHYSAVALYRKLWKKAEK